MLILILFLCLIFFFKQKTAYEMRISDWSSDVCSSDLKARDLPRHVAGRCKLARQRPCGGLDRIAGRVLAGFGHDTRSAAANPVPPLWSTPVAGLYGQRAVVLSPSPRSEEHTSELQSLMRISYAVFCLKKKIINIIIGILN